MPIGFFVSCLKLIYDIAKFYYLQQLSQTQTAKIIGISQAAVSRRLEFIKKRIKYLLKMPTVSPIQVRVDFKKLFPIKMFEPAYYVYFEPSQSRVKYFLGTSQSGAANKIKQINKYLSELKFSYNELEMVDKEELEVVLEKLGITQEELDIKLLATFYHSVFKNTQERASIFTFLFKPNDRVRMGSLEIRDSYIPGVNIPLKF